MAEQHSLHARQQLARGSRPSRITCFPAEKRGGYGSGREEGGGIKIDVSARLVLTDSNARDMKQLAMVMMMSKQTRSPRKVYVCERERVADHNVAVLHTGELTNCLWAEKDERRNVLRERKERRG